MGITTAAESAAAMAVLRANKAALSTPAGWDGAVAFEAGGRIDSSVRIGWYPAYNLALEKDGGGYPADSAILAQLDEIETHDFVPRNVAAPTIAVPAPFDAAITLDRSRTHIATWPSKQLLDPALAAQLDRYLVSAADAYRRNQFKAGKEHIETLREILKREHKDIDHDDENENGKRGERNDDHRPAPQRTLIDRLAARVLDFDLKYVIKRMEREETGSKK
ncbi:MAG: hypothetical protein EPO42_01830 [Gallionellaceae bacterium]|nr:MAG: hypothetical protein EPO42_01830 [Gallionellaceae bacterium]